MDRRNFLRNMAAGAGMAMLPMKLPELLTDPVAKGLSSVRFIRMYDCLQCVMVNRIDVLWGPLGTHLECPQAVEGGAVLNASAEKPLNGAAVREWLEEQCQVWIPKGHDELLLEAVSSCIKAKDGVVHRSWTVVEHWAEQPHG